MKEEKGTMVIVGKNEDLESALRRFNKKIADAGIMEDLRKNSYFEKPSAKRYRSRKSKIRS